MIRIYGSSYTKWVYPTWADLMKGYYDVPIRNYGVPGYSMQGLKRLVYTTAQQDDTVIVMWGNPSRMDYGVDLKFITERPEFAQSGGGPVYENRWGINTFVHEDMLFARRKHADTSLFEKLNNSAECIVETQNFCEAHSIEYRFANWANLFVDMDGREGSTPGKPINLERYLKNPLFNYNYNNIKQEMFLGDFPNGLLEHQIANPERPNPDWDPHASAWNHWLYFKEYCTQLPFANRNNLDTLEDRVSQFADWYSKTTMDDFGIKTHNEFVTEKLVRTRRNIFRMFFKNIT